MDPAGALHDQPQCFRAEAGPRRGEGVDLSPGRPAGLRPPPDPGPEGAVEEVLRRLGARHAEDDVAVLAVRVRGR
ncbi:hypothetical protein HHL19_23440 [Streptomyces sp. R302]|uniref:hypothetical protein n=1 Tax=unclassified Streptomyces TaxID=2593676 RepID=UPI00145D374B|nr:MULTISPECIES: hypothetical protein [unclassified Streptomyces]NML51902.1 hypothetical protein [Streptomyces sp. R301]NML81522.1 hypothetical protein [Streptomyces sp. R302]